MKACLDVIEKRRDEIEEQQTGIPKEQRLSPQLQRIFGPNARKATAADAMALVGGVKHG